MKKLRATVALVLAFTLLFAMNAMAASALKFSLEASSTTLEPGDSVTITVSAEENPGIITTGFYLEYDDDVFSVESKSVGSILSKDSDAWRPLDQDQNGQVSISLGSATTESNITSTGTLATVVLKVKDGVTGTKNITISTTSSPAGTMDADMNEVSETHDSVTITVNGAHVHNLVKTDAVEAKCATAGNIDYWTCTECNKIFSDAEGNTEISADDAVIPALGHSWDAGEVTTDPGCTTPGEKTYHCQNPGCNETKTEEVEALGHNWDAGEVTTDSGCTTPGEKTYHCQNPGCNETKTEEVEALGHNWDAGEVTTDPGCTTPGEKTYHCQNPGCNETKTEEIEALGHNWDEGEVTEDASIDENGRIVPGTILYHCTQCQETKEENFNGLIDLEIAEVTNEEAKTKLSNVLASKDGFTGVKFCEITLMISLDNGATWVEVTADMMPAEGIKIVIPYPEGTDKSNYEFVVLHYLANGNVETLEGTKTAQGIEVTVHSLSPFAVGYKKIVVPVDNNNEKASDNSSSSSSSSHHSSHSSSSKSEASDAETATAAEPAQAQTPAVDVNTPIEVQQDTTLEEANNNDLAPKTGDSSFIGLWIMLLGVGCVVAAGSVYAMKKYSSK